MSLGFGLGIRPAIVASVPVPPSMNGSIATSVPIGMTGSGTTQPQRSSVFGTGMWDDTATWNDNDIWKDAQAA